MGIITAAAIMIALSPVLIGVHQALAKTSTEQTCEKTKGGNSGSTSGECQGNRESSPTFEECTTVHHGNSLNSAVKSGPECN